MWLGLAVIHHTAESLWTPLLGSPLPEPVPVQCSVLQPRARLRAWALMWKRWLRNRSKRWGPRGLEGGRFKDEEVIQRWDHLLPRGEFELSSWPPTDFQCAKTDYRVYLCSRSPCTAWVQLYFCFFTEVLGGWNGEVLPQCSSGSHESL